MSNLMLKCKNCGASMQVDMHAKTVTCLHCGTTFLLSEILDNFDISVMEKTSDIDLDTKVKFNDALKQGETYLFQAEYIKAEEAFKLALSYDDKNYKPYLGIVRAKTKNLNIIPPNEDYRNYAKKALELAGPDDYYQVKGDLEKLEVIKEENAKNKQNILKNKEQKRVLEENRRIRANFFSKIAYVLTGLIACAILVGIVVTMVIRDRESKSNTTIIEISSAEQFKNFALNEDALGKDVTIIIKNDIDLKGIEISPIGLKNSFKGTFRGSGHKLKNFTLVCKSSKSNVRVGLFDTLEGANVSGIILEDVVFKIDTQGKNQDSVSFGFISGYTKDSTISLCGIEKSCSIEINNSNKTLCLGGIAGYAEKSKLNTSYSNGSIKVNETQNLKSNHYVGGICGYLDDSAITNCLFAGDIDISINGNPYSNIYAGAITGISAFKTNASSISNSAFAGKLKCITSSNSFVAAVTNYFSEQQIDINRIYENYIYVENFENTDGKISTENLVNFSEDTEYFVSCNTLAEFKEKIDAVFGDSWWDKTNDIPTLKNKITETNSVIFLSQNFKEFIDCKVYRFFSDSISAT